TIPVTLATSQGIYSSSSADEGVEYHPQSQVSGNSEDMSKDLSETYSLEDMIEGWPENKVEPLELDGSSDEVTLRGAVSAALTSTSFVAGKAGKGKGKGKGGKGGKVKKGRKKGKKGKKGRNTGKAGKHPGGGNPTRCIAFGREAARRIAFDYCVPPMFGETQQLGRWSSDCRDVAIDVCQGSVATEVINQCGFLPRTRVLLRLQNQCNDRVRRMIRNSW
ncbi:hypothetical protein ACHAWC_008839, partial [Mediolabrus comicus]